MVLLQIYIVTSFSDVKFRTKFFRNRFKFKLLYTGLFFFTEKKGRSKEGGWEDRNETEKYKSKKVSGNLYLSQVLLVDWRYRNLFNLFAREFAATDRGIQISTNCKSCSESRNCPCKIQGRGRRKGREERAGFTRKATLFLYVEICNGNSKSPF